jgi:preprotein translocase subunit SecA
VEGLKQWAMSAFHVNLSAAKIKQQKPDEIEETLAAAATEQVEKRDCSQLAEFQHQDFAARRLAEWARAKFDIQLDLQEIKSLKSEDIEQRLRDAASRKYRQREVEYPVEFAMNMVFGPQGADAYSSDALAQWANRKYGVTLTAEQIQNMQPRALHQQLVDLSTAFQDGRLEQEIADKAGRLAPAELAAWANQRFGAALTEAEIQACPDVRAWLTEIGHEFMRLELSDLEKYVLLQVCDTTWKDHLYSMDHMKDSIWTRSFAEKDPKVEYKREGFRMFNTMLKSIEERVTDIIFKVHLESGANARSVWNVSQVSHDQVGQFAMTEQQRQAAQAPQGEQKVKQIKLDQPRVGRNDLCPCGSGKKYKKCCGKDA